MTSINILLADDDQDDRLLFQDALSEIQIPSSLSCVTDGEKLIDLLEKNFSNLPDIVFLDLNMPLKTGAECLSDIRNCNYLKKLPVVIFSTSYNQETASNLRLKGANRYIQKPGDFSALKSVIQKVLTTFNENKIESASNEAFLIMP